MEVISLPLDCFMFFLSITILSRETLDLEFLSRNEKKIREGSRVLVVIFQHLLFYELEMDWECKEKVCDFVDT